MSDRLTNLEIDSSSRISPDHCTAYFYTLNLKKRRASKVSVYTDNINTKIGVGDSNKFEFNRVEVKANKIKI